MTNYVCKKCNYKFSRDKVVTRCPYCNTDGSITQPMDAQDLIDSSDPHMGDD